MDKNKIKKLLKQYFEGETNLREEQLLKAYFTSDSVDSELAAFRHLFVFFVHEKQQETCPDFKVIPIQKSGRFIPINIWRWAAAVILIVSISSWYFLENSLTEKQISQQIDWSAYEPETDEKALQLTLNAFKKTSSAIKKSTQVMSMEVREIERLMDIARNPFKTQQ